MFQYRSLILVVGLALCMVPVLRAQEPPPAPDLLRLVAPVSVCTIRGHISDPSGALIPGARITLTDSAGKTLVNATADSTGSYELRAIAPGTYIVLSIAQGFAPFASKPITLSSGQIKRIDIALAIETQVESIVVSDEAPTVNVEASENSSAIILKGADLDALADDPDELSNELTALAGPSAGPNGGQIYIDGFTGGQLPPKSAIREIRINQNPYSAEFDRLGYGRIEVLTKPGTDKLHGEFFIQGNDHIFNSGNPFDQNVQPYHRIQYNGNIHGPIGKNASFYLSAEGRDNHDVQVYDYYPAVYDPVAHQYSISTTRASGSLNNPHNRFNLSPRIDLQLGSKNTLTLRYQYYRDTESGDISSTQLPSQSLSSVSTEHQLQISDSMVINDHFVDETRFQYIRSISSQTPVSSTPTIQVNGDFTGGGSSEQSSRDHRDRFEFQNLATMSFGAHAIKFGTRLRDGRDATSTNANFNGTFTFSETNYAATLTGLANLQTPAQIAAAGKGPSQLTYSTGPNGSTAPFSTLANVFDAALFIQDDWKASKSLTLSGGLRWESQNHISDHSDWAPRLALAYALDGHHHNQTKTVLRVGYGLFYDRLSLEDVLSTIQQNGNPATSLSQIIINAPTCYDADRLATALSQGCSGTASNTVTVKDQIAPNYHSPYIQQTGLSLERQATKTITVTATYLHSFGVHQLVTRNANAPDPNHNNIRPDPDGYTGNIDQFYPEAVFKQEQLITNISARISPRLSIMGFYNFTVARSDGSGGIAAHPYDLGLDFGRARFASRNMVFMTANYTGPWAIRFSPFLIAQSGKPFNIVLPNDLNQDGFFIDRPSYCSSNTTTSITNSYGCFDLAPSPNEKPIPVNLGNGPAAVAVNLRVSRTWGFGPRLGHSDSQNNAAGLPPGGPGGGRGGMGGGGFGPGAFGGFGMGGRGGPGGSTASDRRYSLNFSVQALNLFNNINYGTPDGTLGSINFGRSTNLAGQIFSQGPASRRIFFQTNFSF